MKKKYLLLTFISIYISLTVFGQTSTKTYKTFSDTTFSNGDIILAPSIYFTLSGGARVIPEHNDSVKVIADFLTKYKNLSIEIGVHTDSRGSQEYNLKVSEFRAESMKDVLVSKFGIRSERIGIKGYGKTELLIPDTVINQAHTNQEKEAYHSKNRRIEIKIVKT